MTAIRVIELEVWRRRIPLVRAFWFGQVELTELEHVVVRGEVEVRGRRVWGMAGENLVPKWFEKVAGRALVEDVRLLREAVGWMVGRAVGEEAVGGAGVSPPEELTRRLRGVIDRERPELAALVRQLAVSLVERVVTEAWCRGTGQRFAGVVGLEPVGRLAVRHTVGLSDEVGELAEILGESGISRLKIKLGGDVDADLARVEAVLAAAGAGGGRVDRFTLDGNENYADAGRLRALLARLSRRYVERAEGPGLAWLEQALHRDQALSGAAGEAMAAYPGVLQVIDESDASSGDLPAALALGYAGTTHKNCKGVFKSVRARTLLGAREPGRSVFSGEDLTIVAPWSQAADLAVAAAVGVVDVERNGQHFAAGLDAFPEATQRLARRLHPELYEQDGAGRTRLRISGGYVDCSGVNRAALGWLGDAGDEVWVEGFERVE